MEYKEKKSPVTSSNTHSGSWHSHLSELSAWDVCPPGCPCEQARVSGVYVKDPWKLTTHNIRQHYYFDCAYDSQIYLDLL